MKIGGGPAGRLYPTRHSQRPPKRQSTDKAAPPPARLPRKKALLIGISYNGDESGDSMRPLVGPYADVEAMYQLIVRRYGYQMADITVLRDDGEGVQPTRMNILRAIDELVRDAGKGDRFFFHYCGHTIQTQNNSFSEEDGMDECLVPSDGELNRIMDNELRRHLVEPLPIGTSLVAVFDSCHSASLLDLEHFRCNRAYVPWISKGKRKSDEMWNAIVRKHALPLQALSKQGTPSNSPLASRTPTFTDLNARSPLAPHTSPDQPSAVLGDEDLVPTRPSSPTTSPNSPVVTTRRIYEAARTSRRLQAWRTDVDALEMNVAEEPTLPRAETDGDGRKPKGLRWSKTDRNVNGKRASLPLVPPTPSTRIMRQLHRKDDVQATRERRTTVSRARAVSLLSQRNVPGKENIHVADKRPALKVAVPQPRPVSWLGEERECDSPVPVWPCDGVTCRDSSHGYNDDGADVISLASCKDHQLSWEDSSGGSMTRELVRILDQDPHPTLRSLLTGVSHALHRMSLDRHLATRKYKRDLKAWKIWQRQNGVPVKVGASRGAQAASPALSRASTVFPPTPLGEFQNETSSVSPAQEEPPKPWGANATWLPGDRDEQQPPAAPPLGTAKTNGPQVFDMDNFQDPQLASHRPLDMERQWMM
ncbi:Mitochondrial chaperone BCS1 [Mycena chlorophos]|uniref:Mitochondrial chaperone BCS1 n=1 Tax=Mycena chlorophos TaxID=658473 RepID=A0A8H6TAB2_MYCCL|nr:Mitochondrial chaperone BCS1 [Mycena chlorophos]